MPPEIVVLWLLVFVAFLGLIMVLRSMMPVVRRQTAFLPLPIEPIIEEPSLLELYEAGKRLLSNARRRQTEMEVLEREHRRRRRQDLIDLTDADSEAIERVLRGWSEEDAPSTTEVRLEEYRGSYTRV
ncbi:hypothetical protein A3A21_03800 [Candidatus Jorgensenbacteria bacterium RIFCSPLOWO2_01_FULL_45_25b]|uniref:Uncharacterized protein n=1 Tax=Candidatus Jorgensenbacteria bacterium RIFCSPLOWO2_01_FULL_45_25b TaxID=1798471 RepID=A0A1F6BY18_9BACT|nr:MAG: hypothetical protein A3A21_03800 [Candidatus Jorgensenbacteria bacterium RIFCSPLOWO2_01_FULL_45_25b]